MWEIKIHFHTMFDRDICKAYVLDYIKIPEDGRWEYVNYNKNSKWLAIQLTGYDKYVKIIEYCLSHVDTISEYRIKKVEM